MTPEEREKEIQKEQSKLTVGLSSNALMLAFLEIYAESQAKIEGVKPEIILEGIKRTAAEKIVDNTTYM